MKNRGTKGGTHIAGEQRITSAFNNGVQCIVAVDDLELR